MADAPRARLVGFDGRLHVAATISNPNLSVPVAVATFGRRLLVTELTGEGVVVDPITNAVVREWESQLPVALYAAHGSRVVAVRSPYRVPGLYNEPEGAPLFRVLDTLGRPLEGLAAIRAAPFLAEVVNAGPIAVDSSGAVYFGPLVRDEIRKYRATGELAWSVTRHLYARETDPVYLPATGRDVPMRQAFASVALVLGRDGRLYVLSAADSAAKALRLDVFDPTDGRLVATRPLASRETAIALDARDSVVTFDADSLLAAATPAGREPFGPAFALPTVAADVTTDTMRLADFHGKVTLVNFWASWCDPCRQEFPHMADLYREFDRQDFAIVAISDDVDRGKMLAFARGFAPPFPLLAGGGRMRAIYHYRGLPYSVLLDRHGRIIERIFGFGGAAEFHQLHAAIAKEIAAP